MPTVVAGEAVEDGMAACADDGVVGSWVRTFPTEHTEVPKDGTGVSAADDDREGGTNGGIASWGKYAVRRRSDTTIQCEGSSLSEVHRTTAAALVTYP